MPEYGQKSFSFDKKTVFIDFFKFMRPETSLFIMGMAISGFLFFNPLSAEIFFLALAVFFLSASGYAINYITDREEDIINNKKINYFAASRSGLAVFLVLLFLGLASSLFLSPYSFAVYAASLPLIPAYSLLRIKKIFLLKNLYVGFTMSLMSLVGAVSGGFSLARLQFLVFPFLLGFMINLLGDIRGSKGDREAGVKTLPVLFGQDAAKKIIYLVFVLFLVSAVAFGYQIFYLMLPFLAFASFFLCRNDLGKTRACILASFMFFAFTLFAMKTGWLQFVL